MEIRVEATHEKREPAAIADASCVYNVEAGKYPAVKPGCQGFSYLEEALEEE
ncbi:hypothetical protein [Bacillus piscicola]|uniref:hypothetical protein n=1 Tax=Bacillus piscicola TaxID=1632684 RepID=UPI001F09AF2B|nr:hypothetical protein [Bacillus piscicola]